MKKLSLILACTGIISAATFAHATLPQDGKKTGTVQAGVKDKPASTTAAKPTPAPAQPASTQTHGGGASTTATETHSASGPMSSSQDKPKGTPAKKLLPKEAIRKEAQAKNVK